MFKQQRRPRRKPWERSHERQLKAMIKRRVPTRQIARTLRRSEGAVRQFAFSKGISFRVSNRRRAR